MVATLKPRFTITLEPELLQKVEDFRFEHRYQTRSKAIIELIRLGLEAYEKETQKK